MQDNERGIDDQDDTEGAELSPPPSPYHDLLSLSSISPTLSSVLSSVPPSPPSPLSLPSPCSISPRLSFALSSVPLSLLSLPESRLPPHANAAGTGNISKHAKTGKAAHQRQKRWAEGSKIRSSFSKQWLGSQQIIGMPGLLKAAANSRSYLGRWCTSTNREPLTLAQLQQQGFHILEWDGRC